MKEYSHCYFAFIDLLGFKEIVRNKSCSEIAAIFDEAKRQYTVDRRISEESKVPIIPPEDIHYYIMSDSICIYIRDDIEFALPILELLCMNLQVRMLCMNIPIFVRGSIAKGEIFEEQGVLFGPAFVDAYLRAEKLAHYPRIVIPPIIHEEVKNSTEKSFLDQFACFEQDGFYVTPYLNYFCHHDSTVNHRQSVKDYIKNALSTSLDQSVREKYLYVKTLMDYYCQQEDVTEQCAESEQF